MTIWILSPSLHDTESFVRLRSEIADHLGDRRDEIQHMLVDDSAGSDPEVVALHELDNVEVVTPPFNLGHQRAIVFGLRLLASRIADDDLVVTMDADGEDQPADVPRLVSALDEPTAALALARRTERHESPGFRLMYLGFRLLFRLLTGTSVRSGNFAAQRGRSLVTTIGHPSFDLCYSSTLLTLRRPTVHVPCARGRRFAGESRMSTFSLVAHGIRMLLPFSERIAVRMLVFAALSFTALLAGIAAIVTGWPDASPGIGAAAVVVLLGALFTASFTGFVVLFAGFAQSSGIAVKGIEVARPPARHE